MSDRSKTRLVARIREHGPMTWAEYMQHALYDPADGFFAGSPVGEAAHFVTSPHVSPVFASLIATELAHAWDSLGRPSPFTVIEVGAGDGTLARQVREAAAAAPWASDLRYVCVEQSPVARGAAAARGLEVVASIAEAAPAPVTGVIFANELLDNLPFHRVRGDVEVFVAERDGELMEEERPVTSAARGSLVVAVDGEALASPAARALVATCARMLARGYLLFIDYGYVAGESPGPVRGYRGQRLVVNLLADPGSADITGHVDFDAVAAAARAVGLRVWGTVSQRDALLAIGYRRALEVLRARQEELERAGDWRGAIGVWNQRGEAAMLIDEQGLGGLKVFTAGSQGLAPPLAVGSG